MKSRADVLKSIEVKIRLWHFAFSTEEASDLNGAKLSGLIVAGLTFRLR